MKTPRLLVCVAIWWCTGSANALAQSTPTDVYEQLLHLAAEVDLIRLEMGVNATNPPDIAVADAQPREVYFQAMTLFEKANRLLFEQLRERSDRPASPPTTDITPDDVIMLVKSSMGIVANVKRSLRIDERVTVDPQPMERTPTDVYKLIVRVNRTLNTLLHRRFEPADVYQQLTYGVGLTANILATLPVDERLGMEQPFARRKTPADVYRQLLGIYEVIHATMELSGEKCLTIEAVEEERESISPSDVYDMASLVVSELSYLHSISPGTSRPRESFYPGDKLPSHVYQRAGRLESQLETLLRYVSSHPNWLKTR